MTENKQWISMDTLARYAGHDRVMEVITWLLVLLALLDVYLLPTGRQEAVVVGLLSLALLASRAATRLWLPKGQLKASLDLILLLTYVVAVCWFTGRTSSPFVSATYLILMAASLTLGRRTTYLMAALVIAGYTLLAASGSPVFWDNVTEHAIRAFPFILMAHLGALLSGEAEAARAEVERLSLTDDLTALNNMRSFEQLARHQEKVAKRQHTPYAICMLDADNLKQINDRYGHLAGTELIKWTAELIRTNIRESDIAARFGGDEFIIMYNDTDKVKVRTAVERIVRAMGEHPFRYEGEQIDSTLSAGIASFPEDGEELRTVVKRADQAMYLSKRLGKNRVSLYGEEAAGEPGAAHR